MKTLSLLTDVSNVNPTVSLRSAIDNSRIALEGVYVAGFPGRTNPPELAQSREVIGRTCSAADEAWYLNNCVNQLYDPLTLKLSASADSGLVNLTVTISDTMKIGHREFFSLNTNTGRVEPAVFTSPTGHSYYLRASDLYGAAPSPGGSSPPPPSGGTNPSTQTKDSNIGLYLGVGALALILLMR